MVYCSNDMCGSELNHLGYIHEEIKKTSAYNHIHFYECIFCGLKYKQIINFDPFEDDDCIRINPIEKHVLTSKEIEKIQ